MSLINNDDGGGHDLYKIRTKQRYVHITTFKIYIRNT